MYCKVTNCKFPNLHVTLGHKCERCCKYGHGEFECNKLEKIIYLEKFDNTLPLLLQCKFGGCKYYKYHTTQNHQCSLCTEYLHSNNSCPLLINNNIEIICPICLKLNIIPEKQQKIYGSSDICAVCMDNPVEVFFPACGHVCICINCFKKMDKNSNPNIYNDIRNETVLESQNYDLEEIKKYLKSYPSFIHVYEGNGSYSLIRRQDKYLEGLYIESNYYYDNYKIRKKNNFINGYALVNPETILFHKWPNNI